MHPSFLESFFFRCLFVMCAYKKLRMGAEQMIAVESVAWVGITLSTFVEKTLLD